MNASMNKVLKWDLTRLQSMWVSGDPTEDPGTLLPSRVSVANRDVGGNSYSREVGPSKNAAGLNKTAVPEGSSRPRPSGAGRQRKKNRPPSETVEDDPKSKRRCPVDAEHPSSELPVIPRPLVFRSGERDQVDRGSTEASPSSFFLPNELVIDESNGVEPYVPHPVSSPGMQIDPGSLFSRTVCEAATERLEAHQRLLPHLEMVELSDHLYESYIMVYSFRAEDI